MTQEELKQRQDKAKELMENVKWGNVMESMTGEVLRERVKFGRNFPIPHQISLVPSENKYDAIEEHIFPELIARCPVTGIRDLYKLIVRYIPNKYFPEMKSYKFYLMDYEEYKVPISHETLADKIYDELKQALDPKKLYVELQTAERGEITTTPRVGDMELSNYEEKSFKRN